MPAAVQVKVVAARDLPIMDRSSELTDAFVEVKLGAEVYRTEVCPKTLNPVWDSQWLKFNVNDEVFQDEPLQIKLMDYDVYSAHDAIGRVYISLSYMVVEGSPSTRIQGWFPIFDTLHGVRGEVNVKVQVDLILDQHHLSQSSCQVQFFSSLEVPCGFTTVALLGFVEELVVNDDPEYQWIDKIRTPRASNEVRQSLFLKLSGELQRKVGVKALGLGGNVVLGYHQFFDLEGETGIVVRGIGTCALVKYPAVEEQAQVMATPILEERPPSTEPLRSPLERAKRPSGSLPDVDQPPASSSQAKADNTSCGVTPQSSEQHALSSTSMSAMTDGPGMGVPASASVLKPVFSVEWLPFYTLTSLPVGTLKHIGGLVSAKSVKLLDEINNPDESETRDAWWQEVRCEIRSHTRSMGCNAVIGYMESTSICDTLCVLSALGTAVSVDPKVGGGGGGGGGGGTDDSGVDIGKRLSALNSSLEATTEKEGEITAATNKEGEVVTSCDDSTNCSVCHAPYVAVKAPFEVKLGQCALCHQRSVPSVLLSTGDLPEGLLVRGRGHLVQAVVCHSKKRMRGDDNASHVGKELPFVEYNLHQRLMNRLTVKKMNAIFGLKIQIAIGETKIVGLATGTAVYLEALPPPRSSHRAKDADTIAPVMSNKPQLQEEVKRKPATEPSGDGAGTGTPIDPDDAPVLVEEHHDEVDFGARKDQAPLMVEVKVVDDQDLSTDLHQDTSWPEGFYVSTTSTVPGVALNTLSTDTKLITLVGKKAISDVESVVPLEATLQQFFQKTLESLVFRVRRMHPCVLSDVQFEVDLPEDNEIQVTVTAMATSLNGGSQTNPIRMQPEEISPEDSRFLTDSAPYLHDTNDAAVASPIYMTTLPVVLGSRIVRYLGMINLFLIRESTAVKEEGGLDAFMRVFILQAHSIARAHVSAMGGNALLSYKLNKCALIEHNQQNKAQCLLHLGGDSVELRWLGSASRSESLHSEGTTPVENTEPVTLLDTPLSRPRSANVGRAGTETNNWVASEGGTQLSHQVTSL